MQKMKDQLKAAGFEEPGQDQQGPVDERTTRQDGRAAGVHPPAVAAAQPGRQQGRPQVAGNLEDIANQMEQTEKDIVNRMISDQTLDGRKRS